MFHNIQEDSPKEQLSCNKCNSTIIKTGEKIVKCSSCSSIQLEVSYHGNFVIKFVCNAKLYSYPVDVLANVVLAHVKIGNNEEFIMFMLSNNFNSKHIN